MVSPVTFDRMQVLMLEPDLAYLAQRHEWGADRRDEIWDGVIHLVPQPTMSNLTIEKFLEDALDPVATALGLFVNRNVPLARAERPHLNYRVPDVIVYDPKLVPESGPTSGVELVIEVLSPRDESREKFSFYAERGVTEIWLVNPKPRTVEVFVLDGGAYVAQHVDSFGVVHAPRLDLRLQTIPGPKLRITKPDGSSIDV